MRKEKKERGIDRVVEELITVGLWPFGRRNINKT